MPKETRSPAEVQLGDELQLDAFLRSHTSLLSTSEIVLMTGLPFDRVLSALESMVKNGSAVGGPATGWRSPWPKKTEG